MSASDPTRPARPRRFSALKPAIKRDRPEAAPEDGEVAVQAEPARPEAPASAPPREKASDEARIAKVMARAGLCSRRDAEAWILAGRVAVNGTTIDSPALNVVPGDAVTVDGYPIDKPERTRLFLFHKARGLVTTAKDPEGRPTVFDALPPEMPRVVTIGRLDINTEGLLLLTNDGGLARMLELPATGWIRRYRVRANGTTDQAQLDALAKGVTIDGVVYAGIAAKLDRVQGANLWLTMGLKEGKNREIKRVLEHLGLAVTRLIRISYGPFQLGDLADNAVEEVRTRVLRDQLGAALAKQAGIDLDGPLDSEQERTPAPRAPERMRDAPPAAATRPGVRKVRAKEGAAPDEPRRQTRRTQTADRRGRAVTVERIATASAGREERASRGPGGASRRTEGSSSRTSARAEPAEGRSRTFKAERLRGADERPAPSRSFATRSRADDRGSDAASRNAGPRPDRGTSEARPRTAKAERFRAPDERAAPSRSFAARGRPDDRATETRPARPGRPASSGRPRDGDQRPARSAAPRSRDAERGGDSRPPRATDERRGRSDPSRPSGGNDAPWAARRSEGGAGRARADAKPGETGRSSRPTAGKPGGRTGGKPSGKPGGKGRPPRG